MHLNFQCVNYVILTPDPDAQNVLKLDHNKNKKLQCAYLLARLQIAVLAPNRARVVVESCMNKFLKNVRYYDDQTQMYTCKCLQQNIHESRPTG